MKKFIQLTALAFIITCTACRKENAQQNFTSLQQNKLSTETKDKLPSNNNCPTAIGSGLNRVDIKGSNAVYHLTAFVHNNGAHWLLWELSGEAGSSYQIVSINTNDGTDGDPQTIDMGNINYPKDACFTLSIHGYLFKPKKKDESCGQALTSGVICPENFPPL